jgi:lipoate-protein ligase A
MIHLTGDGTARANTVGAVVPRTPPAPERPGRADRDTAPAALRWRLLVTPPLAGAENMALDAALLARARLRREAVLRVYSWLRPTLSLGRNQRAVGAYSADRAREMGVDVVRRPTGGRAVLHWREITYSVAAPELPGEPLRASYARINRLLLDALRRLGVPAALAAPVVRAPAPGIAPCFETPVAGELVAGGRKLVGSAQYREAGAFLQHGSILVEDDQQLLGRLALVPLPPVPAPATLRALLGRAPAPAELAEALLAATRALEDPGACRIGEGDCTAESGDALDDLRAAARGMLVHYGDPTWTWRR